MPRDFSCLCEITINLHVFRSRRKRKFSARLLSAQLLELCKVIFRMHKKLLDPINKMSLKQVNLLRSSIGKPTKG